jgi:hypothetical protein
MIRSVQTLCSKSDSYKHSHFLQVPDGTSRLLCYLAPRFGKFDETTWYGLQGNLKYNFSSLNPYGTYRSRWSMFAVPDHASKPTANRSIGRAGPASSNGTAVTSPCASARSGRARRFRPARRR